MPIASKELVAQLNPSLDVTNDNTKNTTSITLKNSNDALIRSIFKIKTKNKNTLFNTDEKLIELQKVIDKIKDKEFKNECKKLKKSLQNLINHIKKIKKQKRIDSTVQHLDQLAYELCCDTLYYAEKRDYFNFINTTSRRIEEKSSSIDKPRKFQGLRYILHVITEAFKYLFLIGFYLAYKHGGFSKTTTRGKINQFLKQRIKFYLNNKYAYPHNKYNPRVNLVIEKIHTNCYNVPDTHAPAIDILQKLRSKKIMFGESYFRHGLSTEEVQSTLTTIAQLRWTQAKELHLEYPDYLLFLLNFKYHSLMHAIQKSAVQIFTFNLSATTPRWDVARIRTFTMGLINSQIITLDLKINIASWQTDAIQAFVTGLQHTPVTTLILQENNLVRWNEEQCLAFATGLKNTNVSTLDLSGNDIDRWPDNQIQKFIEALADTPVRSIKLGSIGFWNINKLHELMKGLQKTKINNLDIGSYFQRDSFDLFLKVLPKTKITYLGGEVLANIIEHSPHDTTCLEKIKIQANLSKLLCHARHLTLIIIDSLFHHIQETQTIQ